MDDDQWFYCVKHGTVERAAGCRAIDRLGPYPDRESAAHALETARARTEAADRADRDWADRDGADRDGADRDGADRDGADRDGADRDWADRDGDGAPGR